jgi:hypothetical protein
MDKLAEQYKEARLYASMACNPCGCGSAEWSDQYKGTPLYKDALALQHDDAKFEVARAKQRAEQDKVFAEESAFRVRVSELEAKLAEWKYENMGISPAKTAEALEIARYGGMEATKQADADFGTVREEAVTKVANAMMGYGRAAAMGGGAARSAMPAAKAPMAISAPPPLPSAGTARPM